MMNANLAITHGVPALHQSKPVPPQSNRYSFKKVTDSRGQPIRGLWRRGKRFYAQLRVPEKKGQVKVALVDEDGAPLRTVPQARAALHDLQQKRRENRLPVLRQTPTFAKWMETYLAWLRSTGLKHPLTISKEAGALAHWSTLHGHIRLAQLRRSHLNEFIAWRKETHQISNRTINLDVIALKNCLGHAIDEGLLVRLPTENWRPLEHRARRRSLWTGDQIEQVCQAALKRGDSGQVLADYLRFLAHSGARRNEALNMLWSDVDWAGRRITLRKTKFGRPRYVDLNPALENHLREMQTRRDSATEHLFIPSGVSVTNAARSFQTALEKARVAAEFPAFCFHDLRHYFISSCVMAGIDYLTIAQWVGHRDGGILIGKVYGHLNDEHAKRMAERLGTFQSGNKEAT